MQNNGLISIKEAEKKYGISRNTFCGRARFKGIKGLIINGKLHLPEALAKKPVRKKQRQRQSGFKTRPHHHNKSFGVSNYNERLKKCRFQQPLRLWQCWSRNQINAIIALRQWSLQMSYLLLPIPQNRVLKRDFRRHADLQVLANQLQAEKWERLNTSGWRIFTAVTVVILSTVYFLNFVG